MSLFEERCLISLGTISAQLNKLIELLEIRKSIDQARLELQIGEHTGCTCSEKGKTSAVMTCPIHG